MNTRSPAPHQKLKFNKQICGGDAGEMGEWNGTGTGCCDRERSRSLLRGVNETTWGLGRLQLWGVDMEGMENWWNWVHDVKYPKIQ